MGDMIRWITSLALLCLFAAISAPAAATTLARSAIIEDNVLYLRVTNVSQDLAAEIRSASQSLTGTNQIIGTVLDLRFAGGTGADEAGKTANLYSDRKLPLAVLVDGETHDAAATLAQLLRKGRAGLIFGNAATGLEPDITVAVNPGDEKQFIENPYAVVSTNETLVAAATNDLLPFVDHLSEADLVRQKVKDGEDDEDAEPAARPTPPKPVIHDPVLARAVDLLKGLAIVHLQHP